MKKILIVQRKLQHYRKLLLTYVAGQGEYEIDVVEMGDKRASQEHLETFPHRAVKFQTQGKKYVLPYSSELVAYVKANADRYDHIILEGTTNLAVNSVLCRWFVRKKIPYIVWDAGRRKQSKMTLLRKMAQSPIMYVWKHAVGVIAYSTLAKQYFVDLGIDEGRIVVCQNTLAVSAFDQEIEGTSQAAVQEIRAKLAPNGEKIVLYVGAVEARKRIKDLVQAVGQLSDMGISLAIVGDGDQRQEISTYIGSRGMNNVHMLGSIISGVIPYFLACDLFALPSEGGLALNQAMICSKPVIASSADGTELDLIRHGENGYLFEERNVNQLAQYIRLTLSDDDRRRKMGEKSRQIIDGTVNEKLFYGNFVRILKSTER